ncbi:hypothetical protein GBF38_009085 [Nibea albiflora]|uniref:Uncharacterized protein n=1 Tax=Nibea albiflora TaxID=240163 RepID=A0ACB7ES78_NIBAL|nr:hypothetical protein GBF38_009085 [Nibea albiflora]
MRWKFGLIRVDAEFLFLETLPVLLAPLLSSETSIPYVLQPRGLMAAESRLCDSVEVGKKARVRGDGGKVRGRASGSRCWTAGLHPSQCHSRPVAHLHQKNVEVEGHWSYVACGNTRGILL